MATFRECTTAVNSSQRGCRPGTAVNDHPGKTQHLAENAAEQVAHIVLVGAAGESDDRVIRGCQKSDLKRKTQKVT